MSMTTRFIQPKIGMADNPYDEDGNEEDADKTKTYG